MWIRLATFILRYRFPVLAFVVLVTAFMATQAPKVQMSYKFGGILPETDSTQIDYQNFLDQFSEDGNIIVLGIEDTAIYKLENFQAWYDLGNDLRQIDGVDSIFSEAHLVRLVKDTTSRSFVLDRFFKKRPESQAEVDSIIALQRTYPFYRSLLYNDTTHASLMMVFVDADVFNTEDRGKVVDAIHEKTRAFEADHLNIHYSGLPYIRTINAERVKAELGLFVGLAAAVTALIIFLFYRSFKVLVISILVVGIGVVWSMGIIALFDYKLSLLMALIPPLIIVIGIPNCVFLITKYHQEFRKHGNRMKALARVVQRIGNATFMTNLTTALGFATFIFTSSPMLREFGVIASINVLNVFVLSLLIVPTLFSLLPEPKTRHTRHLDRTWVTGVVQWLVRVVQHQRRAIYIITAVVVVLGIYGVTLIKTSGRIVDDLPQGDYILDDLLFFERNFNGIMPLEVLITADKPGQITSDKNLRESDCFDSSGGPVGFADVNADSEDTRTELEIQDTLLLSDDLKLVSGAGFRKDVYRSETYFNGRGSNYQSRYFGNLEYTPVRWLTLNAGGNWERTSTTDDGYFSPRAAANFTFNNRHALRFVFSQAVRTPDGFEQRPAWGYTLRNVRPGVYSDLEGFRVGFDEAVDVTEFQTLGRDLEEETITSREISYFGQFPMDTVLLSLEVRGFKDELRDMISGVIQLKEWTIDNNVAVDQKGFEVEATLDFPGTSLRASYGYLDQDTWYSGAPIIGPVGEVDVGGQEYLEDLLERLSVRHSGSFSAIQELPMGFKAATAFYWADEFNTQFERIDARISKSFIYPTFTGELAFTLQHYLNRDPELSSDNNIKDHNQFFVEAGIRF